MKLRVMWLLNHSSARKFEVSMLRKSGIEQIFLPKNFPSDPSFRSASIDHSEDQHLDIPASELNTLNDADWYRGATPEAWRVADRHFDIVFFILHHPGVLLNAARHFNGAVLWRTYGLTKPLSYGHLAAHFNLSKAIERLGARFYFGEAYPHLGDSEPNYLARRRIHLPLGLDNASLLESWKGLQKQIFFVCPDIGLNPYYRATYERFRNTFSGLNYVIAGSQPVHVGDPRVLGFISDEQLTLNMAQSRVMFYQSQEPNHIHYPPFEAIRAGMPLVFMAGGMLDRMGGRNLPGRCRTMTEARRKIERILADDWALIEEIRTSQLVMLESMKAENCLQPWREGLARIATELEEWRSQQASRPQVSRRKKVAVIVPVCYRGGSLRGALALAKALHLGSRQCGEDADVVFAHLDEPASYPDDAFSDLHGSVARRTFTWRVLSGAESRRAMRYAGFHDWQPAHDSYMVPDDGMQQLLDCDLWLIVSDRLTCPVLPVRPVVLMIYDYLQRYEDLLAHGADQPFLQAARNADRVLVTTEFTRQDALDYAGVDACKVSKVPMLPPDFPIQPPAVVDVGNESRYFLWSTNRSPNKNHRRAAEALQIYYETLDGQWECRCTGVGTREMLNSDLPHLKEMAAVFDRSMALRKRVTWLGELPDVQYRRVLSQAGFLWHAGRIDNGTFSVIEAAHLGVPSLSSDYPAMREIDEQFSLNLAWMDPDSPRQMAEQLKYMEQAAMNRRVSLPAPAVLQAQGIDRHAGTYWQQVRTCL